MEMLEGEFRMRNLVCGAALSAPPEGNSSPGGRAKAGLCAVNLAKEKPIYYTADGFRKGQTALRRIPKGSALGRESPERAAPFLVGLRGNAPYRPSMAAPMMPASGPSSASSMREMGMAL